MNYKHIILFNFLTFYFLLYTASGQNITGIFSGLANQPIKLVGFTGFDNYVIDSVKANEKGKFELKFSKNDIGMAYLLSEDNKSFVVILSDESIKLKGESFAIVENIEIVESYENKLFEQYASEHPRREQALSAWDYLTKIYRGVL